MEFVNIFGFCKESELFDLSIEKLEYSCLESLCFNILFFLL